MTYSPELAPAQSPSEQPEARGPRTYRIAELLLILLAVVISAGAYALVGLGVRDTVPGNVYGYTIWLAVLGLGLHVVTWWRAKYADPILVPVAILLNGLGLAMIYRIDLAKESSTATSQLVWMTLGTVLAALVVFFVRDHRLLRRLTYTCGLAAIVLLLLPLIPGLGTTINGARIWIRLGPFSFQPGEIAKILLAVFFAGYLVSFRDQLVLAGPKILGIRFPRLRDLGPIIIAWVASVGILVFQRDLGTSLLFFGLFVAMLYVATNKKTWIFLGLGMFALGAVAASFMFSHVQQRIDGWLGALTPEEYNKSPGGSYQLVQGMFGMSSGGLTGTGLGEGRPQVVPYSESDFIYASLGEELGMVGLFAILMLYVILFERGMKISSRVRDGFGKLLTAGLTFTIALQVFIVIGGVTRVIPLTGLTTPFLAAGGSSLIANWIIIGLLLRISDAARRPAEEFQTGVLTVVADDSDDPESHNRTARLGRRRDTAEDAEAPIPWGDAPARQDSGAQQPGPRISQDDAPTTAQPPIRPTRPPGGEQR
ncbi:FtsW/RodA/SpoVE family cell cycle protein [Brevibacterium daeguense]|uniref:FtsW/RodA/SpoVE family cell cycle protein n=1 Tax=Brevibacterium daeguense TaxID=909936 RepID=A0ABP8EFG7_9MICO|nr:FtsW/RodA/SpoVE family cell cycle protein [Brevibacterium daeguense]